MPDPISSSNQSLNYTPAEPEEEGGMCVAPDEGPAAQPGTTAAAPSFKTTYGGEIHVEGFGLQLDPIATQTGKVTVLGVEADVTLTGIEALVGAMTKNADGSEEARLAASAGLMQGVATVSNHSGDELALGFSVGAGFDVSSGTRDADGDGNDEYCVRASWGAVVLGGCTEAVPAFVRDVSEGLGVGTEGGGDDR